MRIDIDPYDGVITIETGLAYRLYRIKKKLTSIFRRKRVEGPRPTISMDEINKITDEIWVPWIKSQSYEDKNTIMAKLLNRDV